MRQTACACIVAALALGMSACTSQLRNVTPTPEFEKRLGLPLYPHATLVDKGAQEMTMSSQLGETKTEIAQYETTDDFATVRRFYDERLPSTKRVVFVPLGPVSTLVMRFSDKTGTKQVTLSGTKGVTVIQLQNTTLDFSQPGAQPSSSAPAASTSPSPAPSGAQ